MNPPAWRFGVFEVDPTKAELSRNGTTLKIREQSLRILIYLLEHAGELVTREDLRTVLWPADTYVDFDHSLNTAMMKLRQVLGDSTGKPLYIETIPRRGYRFIAPLSRGPSPAAPAEQEPVPHTPLNPVPQASPPHRRRVAPAVALLTLLLLSAASFFLWKRQHPAAQVALPVTALDIIPITSAGGDAISPSFSPDGKVIAFVWNGPDRQRYDIYAQLPGATLPLRLTYSKSGLVGAPAWSPDGRQIAFTRCDGKTDGVYVVPALGGEEHKLTATGCLYTLPGPLNWLADGSGILMVDRCGPEASFGVVLFSLVSGEKRCLTHSDQGKASDSAFGFALSPDGKTLAFRKTSASLYGDIFTVPLTGGPARQLTNDGQLGCSHFTDFGCSGLMWTPDSQSIVFVSNRTTLPTLQRVSATSGQSQRETNYPAIGSFAQHGRRLVYSDKTSAEPPAIWRLDLTAPGGAVLKNTRIISSQYPEMDAQPTTDNSHLVWMSIRTGFEEIWSSEATGANPLQLTHLEKYSGTPRWSPDGRWIVFDNFQKGATQILAVDSEGRNLHAITSGSSDSNVPSWSHDGKSIYFASKRTGLWQVFKHALEGGVEVQITQHGGFDPQESNDGRAVYYSRFDQAGIWSTSLANGTESLIVGDKPQIGFWGYWAVTRAGIYFLDSEAEPRPTIRFYNFATRLTSSIFTLEKRPARLQPSLSATADGKTVYYAQYDRQSVLKLIEFSR